MIQAVWAWLHSDVGVCVLLALFHASEALGGIKSVAQNSVYQVIFAILQKATGMKQ